MIRLYRSKGHEVKSVTIVLYNYRVDDRKIIKSKGSIAM